MSKISNFGPRDKHLFVDLQTMMVYGLCLLETVTYFKQFIDPLIKLIHLMDATIIITLDLTNK